MAVHAGTKALSVVEALADRAPHFAFMQAMWLLHRAHPQAVGLGHQGPPRAELVRLQPSVSLAFPPGEIEKFVPGDEEGGSLHRLVITFMGLYGLHSPLPNFYSESVLHRSDDEENHAVRAFLDIFNHRLLSLFYRGLIKYRGHLLFENEGADEFSWRLYALSGLATAGTVQATGLSGPRLLRYAGLFSQRPHSAASVAAIIATYLGGLPVRIVQCVKRWVYLRDDQQSKLGRGPCRLGDDATIGARVSDRTGKFRVVIGPVDFDTYRRFLPGGDFMDAVRKLAPLAASDWLAFDVQVILRGEDTPRLGMTLGQETHLGWTSGLFPEPTKDLPVVFS